MDAKTILRWIGFIPASILASALSYFVLLYIIAVNLSHFYQSESGDLYQNKIVQSIATLGAMSVYYIVAYTMCPNKKLGLIITAVLGVIFCGANIMSAFFFYKSMEWGAYDWIIYILQMVGFIVITIYFLNKPDSLEVKSLNNN